MGCRLKQKLLTDFLNGQKEKVTKVEVGISGSFDACDQTSSVYVKRRTTLLKDEIHQYTLDAGQKNIGTQLCRQCGMVYDWDSVRDCNLHTEFHDRLTKRDWFKVRYSQIDKWKKQNFCVTIDGGYLFLVSAATTSSLKHRLEEVVLKCVNVEIGVASDLTTIWDKCGKRQLWGFIASSSKIKFPFIAAIFLTEGINNAFYIESEGSCCKKKSFNSWSMGVNRFWVHSSLRRNGLASRLLDEIRGNMRQGCVVPRERIAFSELTDDGEAFAAKYCSDGRILRYSLVADEFLSKPS